MFRVQWCAEVNLYDAFLYIYMAVCDVISFHLIVGRSLFPSLLSPHPLSKNYGEKYVEMKCVSDSYLICHVYGEESFWHILTSCPSLLPLDIASGSGTECSTPIVPL